MDEFSVELLVSTLFSPWKRITSMPGRNIHDRISALIDNLISRIIGFIVRVIVIISAVFSFILVAAAGFIQIIVWPVLPLAVLAMLILGIINI